MFVAGCRITHYIGLRRPWEGSLSNCYPNALDGNPQVRNYKKCPWERGWI